MRKRSLVHNYFIRNEGESSANCSFCNAKILTKNGNTSAMWNHLMNVHPETYKTDIQLKREEQEATEKIQPKNKSSSHNQLAWQEGESSASCSALCDAAMSTQYSNSTLQWHHLMNAYPETIDMDIQVKQEEDEDEDEAKEIQLQPMTFRQVMREENKQNDSTLGIVMHQRTNDDDTKSKEIDFAITRMIVLDGHPFSIVECAGFVNFIQKFSGHSLKGQDFYKRLVSDHCNTLKCQLKGLVGKNANAGLCLTVDLQSFGQEAATRELSIAANYISDDFQRRRFVLHVEVASEESLASENLCGLLETLLKTWNIRKEWVHLVVRGNERNIVRAVENAGLPSIGCTALVMNCVVSRGVEKQDVIRRIHIVCREICSHFHNADDSRKKLKEPQKRINDDNLPLKLIQESKTRWKSTSGMMRWVNEMKEVLVLFMQEHQIHSWNMDWDLIPEIVDSLKPFEVVAQALDRADASIADVIPRLRWLLSLIVKTEQSDVDSMVKVVRDELREQISLVESRSCFYLATLLDPRYKDRMFEKSSTESLAKLELEDMMIKVAMDIEVQELPRKRRRKQTAPVLSDWSNFVHGSIREDEVNLESSSVVDCAKREMERYLKEKRTDCESNPLEWWQENKSRYPNLSRLARRYLSVPPVIIPSAEMLTEAGVAIDMPNSCTFDELAEKSLFLKYNVVEYLKC